MENEQLEFTGKAIESFERVEEIVEIILLGRDGGIRRIILDRRTNDKEKGNNKAVRKRN